MALADAFRFPPLIQPMTNSNPKQTTEKFTLDPHRLTVRILIGMVAGFLFGLALFAIIQLAGEEAALSGYLRSGMIEGVLFVAGDIFLSALQMLIVPLVFVSLTCGTAALEDVRRLGRVGGKTMVLYLGTTALAIALALAAALLLKPGAGFDLEAVDPGYEAAESPPLTEVITAIFPPNPIDAMAAGNMLQIIVFAILFGVAISLSGSAGHRVLDMMRDLNVVVMRLVMMVMLIAPFGVFALIARTFSTQGYEAFAPLLKYFLVVLGVLFVHAMVSYSVILRTFSGLNPLVFYRKVRAAQIFAFSTASSNATLPVTLQTVEHRLGVRRTVGSFTVPLGATINMDGTAIMQGVAAVFIAQAYGIDLGLFQYLSILLTATLASIGTAGVPGVGLIMLAMVLNQVGLPVEGIGLILGVDRLLDMVRTAVNVTGDSMVSCVVGKSEGEFDQAVFESDA